MTISTYYEEQVVELLNDAMASTLRALVIEGDLTQERADAFGQIHNVVIARRSTFRAWWDKFVGKEKADGTFSVIIVKVVSQ